MEKRGIEFKLRNLQAPVSTFKDYTNKLYNPQLYWDSRQLRMKKLPSQRGYTRKKP